jgi:hypothetical protein
MDQALVEKDEKASVVPSSASKISSQKPVGRWFHSLETDPILAQSEALMLNGRWWRPHTALAITSYRR